MNNKAPNKKSAHKGEVTLRTSIITHGSKGELALRGTFLFGAHEPKSVLLKLNAHKINNNEHFFQIYT